MLCYRDRTFCPIKYCKNFDGCERAMTEKVCEEAHKRGLPISQFCEPPDCFESDLEKEDEDTNDCC